MTKYLPNLQKCITGYTKCTKCIAKYTQNVQNVLQKMQHIDKHKDIPFEKRSKF